jgi:hypothetical protein
MYYYDPNYGEWQCMNVDLGATASGGSDGVPSTPGQTEKQTITFNQVPQSGTLVLDFSAIPGGATANIPAAELQNVSTNADSIAAAITTALSGTSLGAIITAHAQSATSFVIDYGVYTSVAPTLIDNLDTRNEIQTLAFTAAPQGGSLTLTFNGQTTSSIDCSAGLPSASAVQSALQSLPNIGPGNVAVSVNGLVYTVTFQGALAGSQENLLSLNSSTLT